MPGKDFRFSEGQVHSHLHEFYSFSHPLLIYYLVGLIVGLLDRWLLQVCNGSIEQGFYSFSYQLASIGILFTSAMTPLLLREFAIAYSGKRAEDVTALFRRYVPAFYSMSTFIGCFVAVHAGTVSYMLGGRQFEKAWLPTAIMAFYPPYQTYGQLSGSVFYATDQTRLYRNIGCIAMVIGLPITFFLIAPRAMFGLNLGAVGLSIKMVVSAFILINIQLWFNARYLNLSFKRLLYHQFSNISLFLFVAWSVTKLVETACRNMVAVFMVSGFLYTTLCLGLLIYFPALIVLYREDLTGRVARLVRRRRGR